VRVTLDATPLLGRPTGIGRYVGGLVSALPRALAPDDDVVLTAFTWRGHADLTAPPGTRLGGRRVPARALQAAWQRSALPPIEWLAGRTDVVHGTNFVLPPARRAAGAVTVHDLTFELHPGTVTREVLRYRQLVPRALRRADVVLTVSAAVADEIAERYAVPRERIVVTGNGVDAAWSASDPLTAAELAARGLPEHYLLFVGAAEPRKRLPVLLAALAELRRADPGTPPLVIAGPPGWGDPLDTAALPPEAVVTTGYLPESVLQRVVAGASALAFPSVYEGFGLPPLEAMACGVPVVASDIPAVREVTGELARLVPPDDPGALAEGLADVLRSATAPHDAPERVARRAHAAAWTWDRVAERTAAAYRQAVGG
jgi:glycosyltransferase involved in cell wall biosynthesis